MSTQEPQFSDEELRAIEAEMQKITVDDVLLQTIVTLLNVGARKAGLATQPQPGETPPEPDLEQVRQAVEGARALLPLVEARHGEQLGPVKDALSRLQMFYAQRAAGRPGGEPAGEESEPAASGGGSAQSSGRLWVPGQ
ncbi:MAG TPA: hypothetical protein VD836_06065 [Solirubrobacteraceae bacterium]|nr:hypothetical protein [Solirubrobacteraceae bacterium]